MRLYVGHTHELDPTLLEAVRRFLVEVFDDEFSEQDWEHSLGGIHVIAFDGDDVVGHASVVQRQMIVGGRTLRIGYVEGVGVRADRQRAGIGGQMMSVLEGIIERAFDFGALSASDAAVPMYAGRGWTVWRGPLSALTPDGVVPTPEEEGGVYVWNQRDQDIDGGIDGGIDVAAELSCDWRAGDLW